MTSTVTAPDADTQGAGTDGPTSAPTGDGDQLFDPGPARLRLSFSRVDTYRSCPLRYRYAYVDDLPAAPSPHLSWGSSLHDALEFWWTQKLPHPPSVEELLKSLYENWDDTGFAGMAREEKIGWYRTAQEVLRRHHERHVAGFVPAVASEQQFSLDLGPDLVVVGVIDHVARTQAGGIGIVDWKTNKRAKVADEVRASLQLAIYALAAEQLWGQRPEWVALDFVVPGVRVTVGRDEIDTDGALETIRRVADLVRAEHFDPKPSRLCDWCDFRALCPAFQGDGPDVAGLAVTELAQVRRRQRRDADRAAHLEQVIRSQLGEQALVELDPPRR